MMKIIRSSSLAAAALLLLASALTTAAANEDQPLRNTLSSFGLPAASSSSGPDGHLRRRLQVTAVNNEDLPDQIRKHEGFKTVLVTGAAGFVGSHVSDLLLKRGDYVIVLDEVNDYYDVNVKQSNLDLLREISRNVSNGNEEEANKRLKIYKGDVCNETLVESIFQNDKPDWVVHMAARAGVRPSIIDPFVYIHSNIQGTSRLFELAIKYKVINFVYASSSSVYGGSKSTLFDEHENVDFPISSYAASKRVTELQGMYYNTRFQLPSTALRFFTVYGPRGRPDMAPFKFIDWTARGKPIQQFGNGSSSRDYTYIEDIVSGVVGSLDRPYHKSYRPLNLGKGSGTALSEFVKIVSKYVGKEPQITLLPDQPGDVPYTCANVSRAHNWVNYTANTMFEMGISKTVEWYKKAYPYEIEKPAVAETSEQKAADEAVAEAARSRRHRRRRLQVITPEEGPKKVLVVAQQESALLTERVVSSLISRGDSVTVIIPTPHTSVDNDGAVPEHYPTLAVEDYTFAIEETNKDKLSVYPGSVDNATFLEHVMAAEKPKYICYLNSITNATASNEDPYSFYHINLQAYVRLLEVSRKHHEGEIANLVILSSTGVYEPQLHQELHTESENIQTYYSHYSISQKARELYSHTWHSLYKIPMTALRIPQVFGPGCDCKVGSEDLEVRDTHSEEEMKEVKEFIFVDDAVDGIIRALDRPYPYQIFNLPGGKPGQDDNGACQSRSSLKEMVMAHLEGKSAPTTSLTCARGSAEKAMEFLGYQPKVALADAVEQIAQWYRQHEEFIPASSKSKLAQAVANAEPAAPESKPEPVVPGAKPEPAAPVETEKENQVPEPAQETPAVNPIVESSDLASDESVSSSWMEDVAASVDASSLWPSVIAIPGWIRELAQIQWILICVLLVWKVVSVRGRPVRANSNSSLNRGT
uniref:NAD-dependent epimerase/dehydratase domain-containing protein n=1 Tax=Entomoneis paludosa TaxID=265537 RepID=A0A7S2YF39_9STRA|mmetsp:Transcript_30196/g.63103  ORF Transcript_30196/g.63103 Transcript_30196/m.63103 type:complete len:928 (+) Transcript_30196:28-2811(+)